MHLSQFDSLSEVLNFELSKRKEKNASYSLRAFARDLELSPSSLSEVMQKKNGVSSKSLEKISNRITKTENERQYLTDLVLAEFSKNTAVKTEAGKRLRKAKDSFLTRRMKIQKFRMLSQWYHSAIYQLIELDDFCEDPAWIAEELGITTREAKNALDRLEELELIYRDSLGNIKSLDQSHSVFSDVPEEAIRLFHKSIIQQQVESLDNDPMSERENLSMYLAIPSQKIPEFKRKFRDFVTEFWRSETPEKKDKLYSFSLNFSPVKKRNEREKS